MKKLFEGSEGRERLVRTLLDQKIVNGQVELAAFLADKIKLIDVPAGKVLIEQRDESHEVYFIIAGQFSILVNGKHIANRFAGEHVGEIAAFRPNQRRSATVVAQESSVIGSMGDSDFIQLADRYPSVWRTIAAELAKRLEQRNRLIAAKREKVRALVISSSAAVTPWPNRKSVPADPAARRRRRRRVAAGPARRCGETRRGSCAPRPWPPTRTGGRTWEAARRRTRWRRCPPPCRSRAASRSPSWHGRRRDCPATGVPSRAACPRRRAGCGRTCSSGST